MKEKKKKKLLCKVKTRSDTVKQKTEVKTQKTGFNPLWPLTNFTFVFHEPKLCKSAYFDRYSSFSLM